MSVCCCVCLRPVYTTKMRERGAPTEDVSFEDSNDRYRLIIVFPLMHIPLSNTLSLSEVEDRKKIRLRTESSNSGLPDSFARTEQSIRKVPLSSPSDRNPRVVGAAIWGCGNWKFVPFPFPPRILLIIRRCGFPGILDSCTQQTILDRSRHQRFVPLQTPCAVRARGYGGNSVCGLKSHRIQPWAGRSRRPLTWPAPETVLSWFHTRRPRSDTKKRLPAAGAHGDTLLRYCVSVNVPWCNYCSRRPGTVKTSRSDRMATMVVEGGGRMVEEMENAQIPAATEYGLHCEVLDTATGVSSGRPLWEKTRT